MIVTSQPHSQQSTRAREAPIPTPEEWFGERPGRNGFIASTAMLADYLHALAETSDRISISQYGEDLESEPLLAVTVTARENRVRLPELAAIQRALCGDCFRSDSSRAALCNRARGVVLVTCGIHGTELGAPQMVPHLLHHLAADSSPETRRIVRELVVIVVPSLNPSGLEFVRRWHERTRGGPHDSTPPPGRFQRFAGHDNNRDWIAQTQPEIRATVERLLNVWLPHVVIDLHQMHGTGPRYILPPYPDPFDPNVDPMLQQGSSELGSGVLADLTHMGLQGVATGVLFDAFSPSRAYAHYHGGVRLLGEAAAAAASRPIDIHPGLLTPLPGYEPLEPSANHPLPWPGGAWGMEDVIDAHFSVVMSALRRVAGERAAWIERQAAVSRAACASERRPQAVAFLPEAMQRDPSALRSLLDFLRRGLIEVARLDGPVRHGDGMLPAGSWIVRFDQPFGGYARTLLLPMGYPGEVPPYDTSSHCLPLLMDLEMIAIDAFTEDLSTTPASERLDAFSFHIKSEHRAAIALSPSRNDVRLFVNEVLREGAVVHQLTAEDRANHLSTGTFVVPVESSSRLRERLAARDIAWTEIDPRSLEQAMVIERSPRVGLYASYRPNSADEGWTQFVLETHGFGVTRLCDGVIRTGGLIEQVDAIVVASMSGSDILHGNNARLAPPEYCGGISAKGVANLRRFVADGGRLILLDRACDLGTRSLKSGIGFVKHSANLAAPGSILRLHLRDEHPVTWGYRGSVPAMVTDSPLFDIAVDDVSQSCLGWFDEHEPLLSGWLPENHARRGACALAQVDLGRGSVTLFGFRPQFRGHALGTYRLLFNAITQPRPMERQERPCQ